MNLRIVSPLLACLTVIACDIEQPLDDDDVEIDGSEAKLLPDGKLELTAPADEPVEIYGDDAPGPGGGDEPLPDLTISQTTYSVGTIGDYWAVWFTIKNTGAVKAPASKVGVLLLDDWNNPDPNGVFWISTPELAAGASRGVAIRFATTQYDIDGYEYIPEQSWGIINYKTKLIVDHGNAIVEKAENNNSVVVAW